MTPKLADFKTNLDTEADNWSSRTMAGTDNYMYVVSVDTKYPIQDSFYLQNKLFDKYAPMINTMLVVALVSIAGVFYLDLYGSPLLQGAMEKMTVCYYGLTGLRRSLRLR